MKYAVLLCDGMADLPREDIGGTPMSVAHKPNMAPLNNVWHCSGRFRQKWHASWITSIHYMMKKSVIM